MKFGRLVLIYLIFLALPSLAKAYVIPAFPVQQAFLLPRHPTGTSVEKANLAISMNDGKAQVVSELELLAKIKTAISLIFSHSDVRNFVVSVNGKPVAVKDTPSGCSTAPLNNGPCYYQVDVALPAGQKVAVLSRYELKAHSGASASSLYGNSAISGEGRSNDEKILREALADMQTYALTLKGLKRWPKPPSQVQIALTGADIIANIRDLSPAGWSFKNGQLMWHWLSSAAPLPPIDIAWQVVNKLSKEQETAIYKRLPATLLKAETKDLHLLSLERFSASREQYSAHIAKTIEREAAGSDQMSSDPANDMRTFLIPELIAATLDAKGPAAAKEQVDKYMPQIDTIQDAMLLNGLDLAASDVLINLINQLTIKHEVLTIPN